MKTFTINTLGCKVNQYESQQIRQLLGDLGLSVVCPGQKSDLVIVNTCCVTATASAKSRQYISKARKQNPHAVIVVAGCLPTVDIGELASLSENIHFIKYRHALADTLTQLLNGKNVIENPQAKPLPPLTSFQGQTRAFLKVQDGCDGCCSYCIIPKTRPIVQSKTLSQILDEAQSLVNAGHREIVVTGVFLGAFGQNTVKRKKWPDKKNEKLLNLLEKLAEIPNLERIRLSSLEPTDICHSLLDLFCKYPNIMPHLHLSLQSGSNAVLKKMGRQYRVENFIEKIEMIKSRLDTPAITTDIIVGFPGETEDDFERTADLAKQVGFARIHVFAYSARPGTLAADMPEVIENNVIKERSKILRDLGDRLAFNFRQQFIGQNATVLTERSGGNSAAGNIIGRTERYFTVLFQEQPQDINANQLINVTLIENTKEAVLARKIRH